MNHPIHRQYIDEACKAQVFPGGQCFVRKKGEILFNDVFGCTTYGGEIVTPQTRYDIASLTKMFTWTLAMQAVEQGLITWETPLCEVLKDIRCTRVTFWHLCTHTSGIRENFHSYQFGEAALLRTALMQVATNPGGKYWYSCTNSILAGFVLEQLWGISFAECVDKYINKKINLLTTSFVGTGSVAPTEECAVRGHVCGVVHDEKAYTLQTPIGNAGIFSTKDDLVRFLDAWTQESTLLSEQMRHHVRTHTFHDDGQKYGIGWVRDRISIRGTKHFEGMLAHAGFTGCEMIWWPEEELFIVVLTNRTYPSRANSRFTEFIEGLVELSVR